MIMKENKRDYAKLFNVLSISLILLIILTFCILADYSLLIPVILLLIGLHFYFIGAANKRFYLNLGLLLTIVVFTAHVIETYTDVSTFYIPVAAIAMLTILLFKDLWLAFVMSLVSSLLVTLSLHGNFNMLLTFFIGSLVASYTIQEARTRGRVMIAGISNE